MTFTRASILTWLRDVFLPSSNISSVLNTSKVLFHPHHLPFRINKEQFVTTNSRKWAQVTPPLAILLHLAVTVKWILDQWLKPENPAFPIWKIVVMYYCATAFSAMLVFLAQLTFLKEEAVQLLNSTIQVEKDLIVKGGLKLKNMIRHIFW